MTDPIMWYFTYRRDKNINYYTDTYANIDISIYILIVVNKQTVGSLSRGKWLVCNYSLVD